MEYSKDLINTYRKKIFAVLKYYEGEPVVIEGIPSDLLKQVLFSKYSCSNTYYFNSIIYEIIEKIDYSNVSFDGFSIYGINFGKLKNVWINPDTIDFYNEGSVCYFKGVNFTKEINKANKLLNISFKGSSNALLNIGGAYPYDLFLKEDDFCDATFKCPIANAKILYCNFEGSHGAIIDLGKVDILDTILYDAKIFGKFDLLHHREITPSIEEIKKVYGDLMEPTLIRRKDFN